MTTTTAPLIRIRDASKVFRSKGGQLVSALSHVDFEAGEGEFISLVGQSGCGKSTLLNMIGGLLTQSSGSVTVAGEEMTAPRADIGYMQQTPVLLPWKTVFGNVLVPLKLHPRRYDRAKIVARAHDLLDHVGLGAFADSYPRELSGGMQQRASLVRTLVYEPRILLMDEPFAALDEFTRESMNMELLRLWAGSGITVVFVTHNIGEATLLSDRVVVMSPRPGRITAELEVPLARPRVSSLVYEPEFVAFERHVRETLSTADDTDAEPVRGVSA
ncbi:ABC transporter ATP-binding protein [Mycobacterium sp. NAZ190054]|uniref:ABC transporter ATP-binding protein n=1 Tax=Mycobacterium sp. NAZ190054 TaxID=1747766 RepID=UPI0007975506|nr:ABC transporter ATP-binding protein [Mycobacterium sp. NAZ190054]KWX67213.1 hypothetical protein ASJ79_22525 [Mycobacterium sp. NAZ190054]